MEKPVVFFSHSSKDEQYLRRLKQMIDSKTGEAIIIFLSSDGQSIPFGRNWVHKIEEALGDASLMFVFISPNSLGSNWIYFEAGYAYSRDIKVVPVGILGVDLNEINPPLSLLQGFNLNKPDALGNLISIINDAYNTKFDLTFDDKKFSELSIDRKMQLSVVGVSQVSVNIDRANGPDAEDLIKMVKETLGFSGFDYVDSGELLRSKGFQINANTGNNSATITVDGLLVELYWPIVAKLVREKELKLRGCKAKYEENFRLVNRNLIRQSALVHGTDIQLDTHLNMKYRDMSFRLRDDNGFTELDIKTKDDLVSYEWLREICQMLLEKQVIVFDNSPRVPVI